MLFFLAYLTMDENSVSVLFPKSKREIGESHYGEVYYLMSSTLPSTYKPIIPLTSETEAIGQKVGIEFNVKLEDLFGAILSIIPILVFTKKSSAFLLKHSTPTYFLYDTFNVPFG